ncbi:tripartite tricarboxylate transporter substrate binding protein [Zwartia sp.]|uniref:Bug family tripartite tricarboxylate transporter substrate binding protein n=1 Tax=Zwartia sp. TaxID=2978004 RepID=UPI00271C26C1|nr:tripartite tricarboxylate transporter substrate binding protein [Zwartia sp.]MDO9025027.1 tripartite tricarboxylate transporter substrate binding protein [Zwartia sp.]
MKIFKTGLVAAALAAMSFNALAQANAAAQNYPNKPIRWVVPYTPGGFTDNVTRMVTAKVQTILGQPIIIENKPGANSIIGADFVAKAAPDGYTILTVITAHAANATLYQGKLPFDHKALVPVSLAAISPLILTTSKNFPVKNVAELIAFAKANPGKVAYGSSGIGSAAHLTSELLEATADIDMIHVPYKGTAPALADLMANNIQMLVDVPSSMMPHVNGGKVNAIAMFSEKRLPSAPDVPTITESAGPPIESSSWVMFFAPPGTPAPIVDKLSKAVAEALQSPEIVKRFTELGIVPMGLDPAQTGKFLAAEVDKWGKVITTAKVTAQ